MGQLSWKTGNHVSAWSAGYAEFGPYNYSSGKVMVSVRCQLEDFPRHDVAFLDTGASIPVIGGESARRLRNRPVEKQNVTMHTRLGEISGDIVRMTITLIADQGQDLPIESSVLLAEEWDGPEIVLGYEGFLDRLRFALDPGLRPPGKRIFYFGNGDGPID